MKTAIVCASILLTAAGIPLHAQQAGTTQAQVPAVTAQQPSAAASTADMRPVSGELEEKLDSKTAKAGDSVVLKTQSAAKIADGTENPRGSKLVGKVVAVKPSGDGNENSQVALQFDHIELKGGQNVAIRSELESVAPSGGDVVAPDTMAAVPSAPSAASPSAGSPTPSRSPSASAPSQASPSGEPSDSGQAAGPVPGTVVARTGSIAIRTTSIPGVLLAGNQPGQQDPRMGQSAGILLGARQNIHLNGGTRIVVNVVPLSAATGGGQ